MSKRTALDKVRDYAVYLHKPFTYKTIVAELGIPRSTTVYVIRQLLEAQLIVSIGKRNEGIYRAVILSPEELEKRSILAAKKTKSVAQIASEKGCSKEAVYQKIRKTTIPREYRLSANQLAALTMLKDGEVHSSVCYYRTIQQMADKGWTVVYEGLMPKYQITELGKEVLRAQG